MGASEPVAGAGTWDKYSDTWVATDALGRRLPTYAEVGRPRRNRFVGIFYFLWHGAHVNGGPYDVTKILRQDPEAMQKKESPLWGPMYAPHHWGESLFGYYLTDDAYVLRKHAQMLSDAGVDVVIFDVTNQITYKDYYMPLLRVFSEVRRNGGRTPQVAFLCPFWDPPRVVRELYRDLYGPGLYPELWFRWKGKPLILADQDLLDTVEGNAQQDTPVPLQAGHTLGQSFTAAKPFHAASGRFPTWAEKGSAMTLSLYREGPKGQRLASRRFERVPDNAWLSVRLKEPLPPGAYYLEMSVPQGKVGWWSHTADVLPGGQAFVDGAPTAGDRTLHIAVVDETRDAIHGFFAFRKPQPDYFQGPTGPDMWSWLEVSPQHVFRSSSGAKEQMSVGVAQNAVGNRLGCLSEPGARGRSFQAASDAANSGGTVTGPDAVLHGYNVAEQWERALKEDPEFVFITGWNEWIMGRFDEFAGVKLPVMFVDQFDHEHSRDIEPMKGGHGDNYYYQMVSYIRRFKGVRRPPAVGRPRRIDLDGTFAQWADVRPELRDDIGDESRRDHPGWNNCAHYTNKTGRNDLALMKVARDSRNVYFYAQTREPITPHTDPGWMLLFIDVDGDRATGWEGYNCVVNRTVKDATTTVLEANAGGWSWRPKAEVRYRVHRNELMLAIPRAALGLGGRSLRLDFKWADNLQNPGEVNEFLLNGDSAPGGRFNYRYEASGAR